MLHLKKKSLQLPYLKNIKILMNELIFSLRCYYEIKNSNILFCL